MTDRAPTSLVPGAARATGRALAEIDLAALRHNVALLRRLASPASVCAVVKADAYGHGAPKVAGAAIAAGAAWLAVATVEEGVQLRDHGIEAPVLVLSEPDPREMEELVGRSLTPTLYSARGVVAAELAAAAAAGSLDVHVKVDTGMHRVGADPSELASVVSSVESSDHLRFAALWTHLAVAESMKKEDRKYTLTQLERFAQSRRELESHGSRAPMAHAANSAAAICFPESRFDLVRCGIALYGSLPSPALAPVLEEALSGAGGDPDHGEPADSVRELRPVMTLRSEVSHVRTLQGGERPSYGRLRALASTSEVATVPIGYADGVPRRYFDEGGTVLIGGRRVALAGAVTMDQIVVDCGPDSTVAVGDDVVLIGEQGDERITAWDWADSLGTISYEVLARIGPRVRRVYTDSGPEKGGAKR